MKPRTWKMRARRGFSLVELITVIIIIAILTGAVLLNGQGPKTVEAFTEAGRMLTSVRALRAAWLSHYAQTFEMLTTMGTADSDEAKKIKEKLTKAAGRVFDEDTKKYGDIDIIASAGSVYIGFSDIHWADITPDPATQLKIREHIIDSEMFTILKCPTGSGGSTLGDFSETSDKIYVRVY